MIHRGIPKVKKIVFLLLFVYMAVIGFAHAQSDKYEVFIISATSQNEMNKKIQSAVFDSPTEVKTCSLKKPALVVFGVNNPFTTQGKSVNVVFDIKVKRPDQTILFDLPAFSYAAKTSTFKNYFLADKNFSLIFEESDPEGEHSIEVVARDLLSGREAKSKSFFIFKKTYSQSVAVKSINDLDSFAAYYYREKNEASVISTLEYLMTQEKFLKNDMPHVARLIHFFSTIGHNDPVILERMKALQHKYSG